MRRPGVTTSSWGVDLKRSGATYDYLSADTWYSRPAPDSLITGIDSTVIGMQPSSNRVGLYVADRFRVLAPLAVEAGLLYDAAPYADDQLISPRINFVYNLGKRTSLRGGLGLYRQSQGIHEIRVEEGEGGFLPAEKATHRILGIEHYFDNAILLRLEDYHKRIDDRHPSYRNWRNDIELFPEMLSDRFQRD